MNDNKNFYKNTAYSIAKTISTMLFPLITIPYVARVLGADNLGKVNYGTSIINYFSQIAALGISVYAVRECAKVRDDREKLGKLSSQLLSINIFTTIFAYILLAVLLVASPSLAGYRILIAIQSIAILFTTLGMEWLNMAVEDFKYITIRTLLFQFLSLVLMLVSVRTNGDYLKYAIIIVIASSGANICNIFYRKKYCRTYFTLHTEFQKHAIPILTMFAMFLSQLIFTNMDTTMIGYFRGDREVGLYTVSTKIYNVANSLVASIVYVVMPQLSQYYLERDYKNINNILRYALNYIIVLGIPIVVGINLMAGDIVVIVGGSEYADAATSLRILTATLAVSLIGGFVGNIIFLSSGREKNSLLISAIAAIVNAALNFLLIPKYGLNAAALTTAIAQTCGLIAGLTHVEKEIQIDGLIGMLRCPLLGAICIAAVCICTQIFVDTLWARALLGIGGSVIVYLVILLAGRDGLALDIYKSALRKLGRGIDAKQQTDSKHMYPNV